MKFLHYRILSRRGDSNARPPRPERGALPTALLLALRSATMILLSSCTLMRRNLNYLYQLTPRNPPRYALLCTCRYIVPPSHALDG